MARSQCPSTPFSTPLSGSAQQAEARIRNLFQGPKRRPPVWLMVLALLLILSCGGLVTCQDQKVPPEKAEISALSASATSQPLSSEDLLLVDALYGAAAPQMGTAEDGESIPQLLCAHSQDGTTLAAALFQKDSASWLVIGAVEQATSTLRGPAYVVSGPEGTAHIFPFREYGSGQLRLLYTFNTLDQGSRSGSAGVVCLEDSRLTWAWPAEGDILEEGSRAAQMEHVDMEEARRRAELVVDVQSDIIDAYNESVLGTEREVLCEGFDSQAQMHFGRSYAESPDIDGRIYFDADREIAPGTFVTVRLTGVMDGELTGELAEG